MTKSSKEEKATNSEKIVLTFNCNGSNIGNGVGIGNGNLNGGGSGSSDFESNDGSYNVCKACTLPCQKFYLVQSFNKNIITSVGERLVATFSITNTSGGEVKGPIVLSSSLFGTIFVSDHIIDAGETVTLVKDYIVQEKDISSLILSIVSFIAAGISTGVPGRYNSGERYSDVVVDKLPVVLIQ